MMRDGLRPVWQSRRPVPGCLTWDILNEDCPAAIAGGVVLALAGGRTAALSQNTALALAAWQAAADQGARHVFLASSTAVYGSADGPPVDEMARCTPAGAYGGAKLEMEQAVLQRQAEAGADAPGLTILRIGNIAGLDCLLGGLTPGMQVVLDPVQGADGGPVRSYIGPVTLAAVLARLMILAAGRGPLPDILNVATPQPVSMAALLEAAGADWRYGAPKPGVIARVAVDTGRLQGLVRLPPPAGRAASLVAEWRSLQNARQ